MLNNKYKSIWEKLELSKKKPIYASEIITVNYDGFAVDVEKQDGDFVNKIGNSLYKGDIYILKNGFPKIFMEKLDVKIHFWEVFFEILRTTIEFIVKLII